MQQLKNTLEGMAKAFEEFKAANNKRLDGLEIAHARQGAGDGGGGVSQEAQEYFALFCRTGDTSILAAATSFDGGSGGYFVPEEIASGIGSSREKNNPMRQICRVIKPKSPEYKRIITTGRPASGWVGETSARPETDSPELAILTPYWGGLYANPAATQDLIEDSAFNVAEWFRGEVAKEFSDQEGEAFITGNGVVRPRGLLTFPTATTADATRDFGTVQYVPTGVADNLAADCLMDMIYKLKAKYRQNAVWLVNSLTLAELRKFKDGEGNFLWRPGLEAGQPGLLLGFKTYECDFMPDVAANAFPIAFGDFFEGFWIFDRPTTVLRDPYTNKPYVNFYTATRVGSMLANSEAVKLLKCAVA